MATTRGSRREFELDVGKGEHVPAILQCPTGTARVPAVVLLHGFSSHKERMADSIGAALLKRGVASLAVDLPAHGARLENLDVLTRQNPLAVIRLWRLALHEGKCALRYLAEQRGVDASRLGVAGYSLGAYLALFVASASRSVKAVALAAGGDLPAGMPMERLVRSAADPRKVVRSLEGTPLLMVNGKGDRTIRPAQATALFEAAREPKELRWYAGGHWPPAAVIGEVAEWLVEELDDSRA